MALNLRQEVHGVLLQHPQLIEKRRVEGGIPLVLERINILLLPLNHIWPTPDGFRSRSAPGTIVTYHAAEQPGLGSGQAHLRRHVQRRQGADIRDQCKISHVISA